MPNVWTEEEVKRFKQLYPITNIDALLVSFPRHTYKAIERKAQSLRLHKLSRSFQKEVDEMELSKAKEIELLEELAKRGYTSTKTEVKIDLTFQFPKADTPIRLGVVSCTHLGSKYQQPTLLTHFYQYCKSLGITKIIHCGDIIEGDGRLYRGQLHEMFLFGSDAQREYAVQAYPKVEGITTYIISGNHDDTFWKDEGYDIVKAICERRKDLKYLGMTGAFMEFGKIKIYILHKSGGVAYARSYHLQKIIEQLSPQQKPHILLTGGDHVSNHLPMYRNVEAFLVGCFQAQTPYMKAKGIYPAIQGLILTIHPIKEGLCSVETLWKNYYVPREHDY